MSAAFSPLRLEQRVIQFTSNKYNNFARNRIMFRLGVTLHSIHGLTTLIFQHCP
jgi:hypothetical protein